MSELKEKQALALKLKKPLIIYFYTDYCSLCRKMKATTYKNRKIQKILGNKFVAIALNMTDKSNQEMQEVKKHFKVFGTPGFVFFDAEGERTDDEVLYGYQGPDEFYDTLDLMTE